MPAIEPYLEALDRDGYCIIEQAFSDEWCDRAVARINAIADAQGLAIAPDAPGGQRTRRLSNMLQHDDFFQEIAVHETVLAILDRYLDKECLLSGIDCLEIWPGEIAQPLHTDTWWHDDHRFDFPICVNSALALVDFTEDNGATRLVPGSHKWTAEEVKGLGFFRSPEDKVKGQGTEWEPAWAQARKGSMVLWDSRLLHGGGANTTDRPRPAIVSPYVLGWCKQLDNFMYAIPPERARTFPRRLQQLIGLDCYRGMYGHVNGLSPRQVLWGKDVEPA